VIFELSIPHNELVPAQVAEVHAAETLDEVAPSDSFHAIATVRTLHSFEYELLRLLVLLTCQLGVLDLTCRAYRFAAGSTVELLVID
jgi:hypothetical protein